MALWQVELLGGLRVTQAERVITRFETGRVVALLACLALFPRSHPREELIERLWPESDPTAGRNRLRNSLSVLKSLLEPPGVPAGSVLVTDRFAVRLAPQAIETDVARWEKLVRAGRYAEAEPLWKGELLPGFYDDWITDERERLNALHENLPAPTLPRASEVSTTTEESVVMLPGYPTRFFGRDAERKQLTALLETERLVTLTGPGGIGKTRLSVETARGMTERFPGGIAFLALAQRWSADGLIETLPATLQLPPSRTPLAALQKHTARQATLLILDNFEQLVTNSGIEVVELLLEHTQGLTLLVTSRRVLGVPGEREVLLEPLGVPESIGSVEAAAHTPGVALFLDRAQASRPRFALRSDNLDSILALCHRLEGLPLAIELAASRVRGYTLAQMEAAMEDRFGLLTRPGGGARKESRHASLRATIEWSWRLLSPESQRLFARLSVFRNGATAHAVAEVCEEPEAQVLLEGLVADSLVVATDDDNEMRFWLLESLREFAAERLPPADRTDTEQRHTDYYLALAAHVTDSDLRTLDTLERELPNIQAALAQGWNQPGNAAFWDGLAGFITFAFYRGHHRAAVLWAERVVASWETIPGQERRLELLNSALFIYIDTGRITEFERYTQLMRESARAWGLPIWEVHASLHLGYIANIRNDSERAYQIQQQAIKQARELQHPETLLRAMALAGRAASGLAHSLQESAPERTQALAREVEALVQEALPLIGTYSEKQTYMHLLLSTALRLQGRAEESRSALKAAQRYALDLGHTALLMYTFWHEATSLVGIDPQRGALCYGAFCRLREQMDYKTPETIELEPGLITRLKEALGESVYQEQIQRAQLLSLPTLVTSDSPSNAFLTIA